MVWVSLKASSLSRRCCFFDHLKCNWPRSVLTGGKGYKISISQRKMVGLRTYSEIYQNFWIKNQKFLTRNCSGHRLFLAEEWSFVQKLAISTKNRLFWLKNGYLTGQWRYRLEKCSPKLASLTQKWLFWPGNEIFDGKWVFQRELPLFL